MVRPETMVLLIVTLAVGSLILFGAWCADPGEYAFLPRVNRLQNILVVLFVVFCVVLALWIMVQR